MSTDYVPAGDKDFDPWFKNITQYVSQKITGASPQWTHIPQEAFVSLVNAYGAWFTAFASTRQPHSPVETAAKNAARHAAEEVLRPFKRRYLDDPPVTAADRVAMGIHVKDTIPTRKPVPTVTPNTEVAATTSHFEHRVRAINTEPGGGIKPEGVHGVRFAWQVGGVRPATGEDLPKSVFSQKTLHVVGHTEADKAQTAYYATCYENTRGERGPWSPVVDAVIG
ncbi:MAG: hypothetical protein LBD31_08645 [Treponema sp.]|jgi:hypothetical protein|nr:hypothetical protein [Treponema sp.]